MSSLGLKLTTYALSLKDGLDEVLNGLGKGVPASDNRPRIFFVIHNKNHVTIFNAIVPLLEARQVSVQFVTIKGHRHRLQAESAAAQIGRQTIDLGEMGRLATNRDIVCMGNDWGPKRFRGWIKRLKSRGVTLVAIVEGARFKMPYLYKRVDHLLCWGPSGLELGAANAHIVGSPVIELAAALKRVAHDRLHVLVNYKFSGSEQDEGFAWGAGAVKAAELIDPEYTLSTHPSSRGVPEGVRKSFDPFHKLLSQSSLVITKSSTVIYEALAAGVSVLYFPTENEDRAEFADAFGAFETAGTAEELTALARKYKANPVFNQSAADAFLGRHVSFDPARSANERIVEMLTRLLAQARDGFTTPRTASAASASNAIHELS